MGRSWGSESLPGTLPRCPSLQVSAGSPHPAVARLIVRAPPSGSSKFLSIERVDHRPPRAGDTLSLNLRAVGISGDSFSHYYYMVCKSRAVEKGRGAGRASGWKEASGWGLISGLAKYSEDEIALAPDPISGPDRFCESRAQEDPDLSLCVCEPPPGTLLLLCGLLLSWGPPSGQFPAGGRPGWGL